MGLKGITMNTPPEAEPNIYAEDDAAIYQALFGKDGVSSIGQACAATVISNNKVRISDGVIVVEGHVARIPYGEYEECEIENGQSGKNRNDVIMAKFETTGTGGIDTFTCEVLQGEAGTTAKDPEITKESLYEGGKVRELPLYRVKIEGLSIVAVEKLFETIETRADLANQLTQLNSNIDIKIKFHMSEKYENYVLPPFSQHCVVIAHQNGKISIKSIAGKQGGVNPSEISNVLGEDFAKILNNSVGNTYVSNPIGGALRMIIFYY